MARYVEVPAADLLKTVREAGRKVAAAGGNITKIPAGEEIAYAITLPKAHGGLQIRVYTSVREGEATARGCGQDAIRIVYGAVKDGRFRPLTQSRRVFRTAPAGEHDERVQAFLQRLHGILRETYVQAATVPRCPDCSGPMTTRKGPRGEFYGCLDFPTCRGTREVAA